MVPGSLSAANRVRKGFNAVDNASDAVRAMDNLGDATRSLDNLSDARRATTLRRVAGNLCHSFAALTLVLMADGSAQRIDQVEVGDRVAAVEVTSGDVVSAEVSVLHRNFDSDLVDVEVVDGEGVRSVVSTTSRHLWWSVDRGGWVEAADLVAGERLWSADGGRVEVVDARWVGGSEWMYDLTVDGVHTFQVLAGDSSVLVHNSNADECLNPGAAGAVSMDEAVARGADHVGGEGRMIESGSGGYQFTQTQTLANGDVVTRNARFDVNPGSAHVQKYGPHLNLETQVNGRAILNGPLADPHIPINPSTIRPGDIP